MSKHFLLTSKNAGITFAIIYFITRLLYVVTPLLTAKLIHTVEIHDKDAFIVTCIVYIVVFVLTQIMDYCSDIAEENCYADAFLNLMHLISRKITRRDYHSTKLSIEEINQLTGQEFEKANKYFFVELVRLVYYIASVLFILTVLFRSEWRIALIITLLLIILIPLNLKAGRTIDEKSDASLQSMSRIKDITSDQYHTAEEDRFLTTKQISQNIYTKAEETFRKAFQRWNKEQSFYLNIVAYGSLNFLIMVMLICACFYVLTGRITFSTLYLFNSYTSQLWNHGEFILGFRAKYQENKPIISKIKKLMVMKETDEDNKGKLKQITLIDYTGTGRENVELHQPLNITFDVNHIYLIKGDNGAGKTTLIENLLHLTKRYNGKILYNRSETYTGDFTYIPSKPYISKYVDEKMSIASDGQKKMYQIQRDLFNAHSVVIMDEPTNYLDVAHKEEFIHSLPALKENHIVIVISHDPVFDEIADDVNTIYLEEK